jgi:hypothetical protein
MWLSRKRFEAHQAELEAAKQAVIVAERHTAVLTQHVAWLSQQLNRVEGERSILLQRLIGLNIPAPLVTPVAPAPVGVAGTPLADDPRREPVAGIDIGALMLGSAAFEDMGDDEARRQGIAPSEPVVALR